MRKCWVIKLQLGHDTCSKNQKIRLSGFTFSSRIRASSTTYLLAAGSNECTLPQAPFSSTDPCSPSSCTRVPAAGTTLTDTFRQMATAEIADRKQEAVGLTQGHVGRFERYWLARGQLRCVPPTTAAASACCSRAAAYHANQSHSLTIELRPPTKNDSFSARANCECSKKMLKDPYEDSPTSSAFSTICCIAVRRTRSSLPERSSFTTYRSLRMTADQRRAQQLCPLRCTCSASYPSTPATTADMPLCCGAVDSPCSRTEVPGGKISSRSGCGGGWRRNCCEKLGTWKPPALPKDGVPRPGMNPPEPSSPPSPPKNCRKRSKGSCSVTLSRLVTHFSRLKSRISRIVAQTRESDSPHRSASVGERCTSPRRVVRPFRVTVQTPVPVAIIGRSLLVVRQDSIRLADFLELLLGQLRLIRVLIRVPPEGEQPQRALTRMATPRRRVGAGRARLICAAHARGFYGVRYVPQLGSAVVPTGSPACDTPS
eukprot:SAG31_NODE_6204_length_2124_cov_1.606914_2_plen_485_part_00